MLIYLQTIDTPEQRSKFELLYREYRGLMFHVANRILENEQDAEDAVHQAFLKIAEHLDRIGEPVCPKTRGFVVTVAENKAIDLYRRRKKNPCVELDETLPGVPAPYEGENVLAECILQLSARYREVLLLRYGYGYSLRETADLMGVTVSAATQLVHRAKIKLRTLYEKEERT